MAKQRLTLSTIEQFRTRIRLIGIKRIWVRGAVLESVQCRAIICHRPIAHAGLCPLVQCGCRAFEFQHYCGTLFYKRCTSPFCLQPTQTEPAGTGPGKFSSPLKQQALSRLLATRCSVAREHNALPSQRRTAYSAQGTMPPGAM